MLDDLNDCNVHRAKPYIWDYSQEHYNTCNTLRLDGNKSKNILIMKAAASNGKQENKY